MTPQHDQDTGAAIEKARPSPMDIIQAIVTAGSEIDPEKLSQMMDLQERHEAKLAKAEYGRALSRFQNAMQPVQKKRSFSLGSGAPIPYASYEDVMAQAAPLLGQYQIAVTFPRAETVTDGSKAELHITCRLHHGEHSEDHVFTVAVPAQMRVNDAQKTGAAIAYAKRYALCAALNIVVADEDDDASSLTEACTMDQVNQLQKLISESGSDYAAFCRWGGVALLIDFPARLYSEAVRMLESKMAKKETTTEPVDGEEMFG